MIPFKAGEVFLDFADKRGSNKKIFVQDRFRCYNVWQKGGLIFFHFSFSRHQHMKGLELVTKITQGVIEGCKEGSREITFYPGKIMGGRPLVGDAETAG